MKKKKSLLERLKLVETETAQEFAFSNEVLKNQIETLPEIEDFEYGEENISVKEDILQGEDFLTVEELYANHDLTDEERSIFKVDELKKHLPENFPKEVLRQTATGLLTSFGLTVEELARDADLRINILKNLIETTNENTIQIVNQNSKKIDELEESIEFLKQSSANRLDEQKLQTDIANEEIEKINAILKFITPSE